MRVKSPSEIVTEEYEYWRELMFDGTNTQGRELAMGAMRAAANIVSRVHGFEINMEYRTLEPKELARTLGAIKMAPRLLRAIMIDIPNVCAHTRSGSVMFALGAISGEVLKQCDSVLIRDAMMQSAATDEELIPWLYGIVNGRPEPAGDFLKAIADAAVRADPENYPILRPALLELQKKFPKYNDDRKLQAKA